MKGKIWFCAGMLFFLHADTFFPSDFDFRYSLSEHEVHIEIGSVKQFDPYTYLLENRHALNEETQKRFSVQSDVDIKQLGNYAVVYNDDMNLQVVVEDTTPPHLELASLSLKQNDAFSWDTSTLSKVVKALDDNETDADTLRKRLHCDNVDTTKSGQQQVNCSVKDNSGNEAKLALAVNVQSPAPVYEAPVVSTAVDHVIHIPAAAYSGNELAQIQEVAALVNQIRADNGLAPLSLDLGDYHNVTYLRTLEVVANYSHTRPNGRACYTIYSDYGLVYHSSGENIARGQQSAQEVVNDWMNSPSHRANILRAEFTKISIGVQGSGNAKYWVQEFFS